MKSKIQMTKPNIHYSHRTIQIVACTMKSEIFDVMMMSMTLNQYNPYFTFFNVQFEAQLRE
jgi:hypothetical protein